MSQYSKSMFGALVAVELAYIGFFLLMTDGFTLGDRSAKFMGFSVLGFLAVVAIAVFVQQMLSKPTPYAFPDEREKELETRTEQMGGRILEGGVFVMIALAIYEAAAGPETLGSYSLIRPEALVFALITISSIASAARLILAIIQDQRP